MSPTTEPTPTSPTSLTNKLSNFFQKDTYPNDEKIQTEKIKATISNYFLVAVVNILTSLLLYFALLNSQNINLLFLNTWLVSQLLLGVFWNGIYFYYANNFKPIQAIWYWYIDMPTSIWAGLGWGLCWVIFIDPNDLKTAFFLNTAITGVVAGMVIANLLDQRTMIASLLPCLLPIIAKAFWLGGDLFNWIAIIATVFLASAYFLGRISQRLYLSILEERELSKQLLVKVEKLNQEKTRFMAAASHDLRQPVQAIRLYEGLLSASSKDESQKALLRKISEANDNLTDFTESLLDIYKLDSGTITANPEIILLNEIFDRIYEQHIDQAMEANIQLTVMPNSRLKIYIDPLHLQRILNNVIGNAIRHMGRPGRIILGVRCLSGNVRIEVHDNGVGIPQDQQEDIFSEFYQINNQHRNKNKGLGLGLSIVKRLAEMNGCKADLTSKLGKGCYFKLHIPQKKIPSLVVK